MPKERADLNLNIFNEKYIITEYEKVLDSDEMTEYLEVSLKSYNPNYKYNPEKLTKAILEEDKLKEDAIDNEYELIKQERLGAYTTKKLLQ